jgi:metal-sulfur cluster biosynthetic enzyme
MSRPPEDSSARGSQVTSSETAPGSPSVLERQAWDVLRQVLDPELGVNIVDLGLVYDVTVEGDKVRVRVTMTTRRVPSTPT